MLEEEFGFFGKALDRLDKVKSNKDRGLVNDHHYNVERLNILLDLIIDNNRAKAIRELEGIKNAV